MNAAASSADMILSAKALHRRSNLSVIPELHHSPKNHTKRRPLAAVVAGPPLDPLSDDNDRPDGPFRTGALISILTGLSAVKLRHSGDRRHRPHALTLDHASPQSRLFDAPRGQGGRHACSS